MLIPARYYDGQTASPVEVLFEIGGRGLSTLAPIHDVDRARQIAHWPVDRIRMVPQGGKDIVLACTGQPAGARLVFSPGEAKAVNDALPQLRRSLRGDVWKQARIISLATVTLGAIITLYIFGVPLFARQIVSLVPPETEIALGARIRQQVEAALGGAGGLKLCDSNPDSLANRAITRFASEVREGTGAPFPLHVSVVQSDIPNAFALPGGQTYYFSALLDQTKTPDEFAAVLAHEIGHVVHRHGMQQLVSSAGTGLLIGFVLGDATGLSVGAILGAAVINTRFSREAEAEADEFAREASARAPFNAMALADLLERVAADDADSAGFALLSTHPLTGERRIALHEPVDNAIGGPPFTEDEWKAITHMCDSGPSASPEVDKKKRS
ncbi:MAG: M48 family metallopeptidase [Hyphomicrobiaceae bacterium]|nr:M48 family metallopeptidase [Hyphomicrobiaceae bacterium]